MEFASLKDGDLVKIEVLEKGNYKGEIWGRVRKTLRNENRFELLYFSDNKLRVDESKYDLRFYTYKIGKEYRLDMKDTSGSDVVEGVKRLFDDRRSSHRLDINVPIIADVDDERLDCILVDISEGGFQVSIPGESMGRNIPIQIYIEDEGMDFKIYGKVVRAGMTIMDKTAYGCMTDSEQNIDEVCEYINRKKAATMRLIKQEAGIE